MEVPGSGSVKILTDLDPDPGGPKIEEFFGSGSRSEHCAPYIKKQLYYSKKTFYFAN
jgi:hypothetical protein